MQKLIKKVQSLYDLPFDTVALLLPRAYDVSAQETSLNNLVNFPEKSKVMARGTVINFRVKHSRRMSFVYADMYDIEGNKQILQWASSAKAANVKMRALQQEALNKRLQVAGAITSFEGREGKVVFISNPKLEEIESVDIPALLPSPVYELKSGIKPHEVRSVVKEAIAFCDVDPLAMPKIVEERMQIPPLKNALSYVHGLKGVEKEDLEEFVNFESKHHQRARYEMIWRTLKKIKESKMSGVSPQIYYDRTEMRSLEASLPFELTIDQKSALGSIFKRFSSGEFKRILLQADVGAGKTVLSIFLAFSVVKSSYQVAVLAPSTVLAKQLYEEYKKFLEPMGVTIEFAAGVLTKKERTRIQKILDKDEPCIVLGTTAVNGFEFKNLGLLIIDEEQKFGVTDKNKLLKGVLLPYVLMMSATPIPRSIASGIYGGFEMIKLKTKPKGRLPVLTKVVRNEDSARKLFDLIEKEAREGRCSLIVCPSINSDEMASIETIVNICSNRFNDEFYTCIHGQLKEKEIIKNINDFREGKHSLLISTSMVDSGFSVPNLGVVVITGPERFGLSGLHQLRGRAGRSAGLQGYCALYPLNFFLKDKANERLEFFASNHDGFLLSAKDLKDRGSGDLTGKAQSQGQINFIEYEDEVKQIQRYINL
jgi:ATP-dependent DNA helicase RecG